jgi:hypothetical protein
MPKEIHPLDAVMPNDLCARCDEHPPEFFFVFTHTFMGKNGVVKLGFCSNECHTAFVRGIHAAQELTVL